MNIQNKSVRIRLAVCVVLFGVILASSAFFLKPELKDLAREVIRQYQMLRLGKNAYVERRIDAETAGVDAKHISDSMILQTAILPLRVVSAKINAFVRFPPGAGSLARIGGRIIIMDRLGGFYSSDGVGVQKLSIPPLPNGLGSLLTESSNSDISMDTFRTHSIAYSPTDGRLYASYEKFVDSRHNAFELSSITIDKTSLKPLGGWRKVFQSPAFDSGSYGLAGGGKILVAGSSVFFAVGDYGFYASGIRKLHSAQDPGSVFGKIFEVNSEGDVTLISIGHRNTQGLVWSTDGQLINVEEGPQGGDELNVIVKGRNYGWPIETFGTDYGRYTWALQLDNAKRQLELPLYSFVPSVAADSIVQLEHFHSRWNGDFLVGSLKAQTLYRIRIASGRVLLVEPIWIGQRIRDLIEINGRVIVLTDSGQLMTIVADEALIASNNRSVDTVTGRLLEQCMSCHHVGPTNPSHLAPSLSSLSGRRVASDNYDRYSPALRKLGGIWTRERLDEFLRDPAAMSPGTAMPKVQFKDGELKGVLDEIFKE